MSTEPRERPILFRDDIVRAIIAGTKTQTRRLIHRQYRGVEWDLSRVTRFVRAGSDDDRWTLSVGDESRVVHCGRVIHGGHIGSVRAPWRVGDRLLVRESWAPHDLIGVIYRADYGDPKRVIRWRPSIHMRRIDARLFLRVTSVRAERVNAISEADARAERAEARLEGSP